MTEKNIVWFRDFLAVPLVVGVLIAAFTYGLQKFLSDSKELSYTVEDSLAYLDKSSIGNASVKVNDVSVPEVFAIKVRLWNSGDLPVRDLAVRFDLSSLEKDFRLLSVNHNTQPVKEFGAITEDGSEGQSKRYLYQLLNPKDEDTLVFLTTAKAELQVFSKAEGLALTSVASNKEGELKWYHFAIGATIASLLSSIVEALFRLARKGWVREVEEK